MATIGGTTTRETTESPESPRGRRRAGRALGHPAAAAVIAWLAATPLAMILPALADANPFTPRGAVLPIAVGGPLLAALVAVALLPRRNIDILSGVSAGLFAAWTAVSLRTALHGTPFGFAGLLGDQGRISAMATRHGTTWPTSDGIVSGAANEYPPLFPWLVGRTAVALDIPAWRLLGEAQTLTISAAVLLAFLLWRRLVPAPVALALAAVPMVAFGDPRKAYEVIALVVFLPWLPAAIGRPARGRLHWLPAGLIAGLLTLTYLGFLIWGALGILAYAALSLRAAPDRRDHLWHLAKMGLVAVAIASWYLIPPIWALATEGGQTVRDEFEAPAITANPFPFLAATPLGALQLAGLLGLVWYRRATWWAVPLLCLLAGAYLYRTLTMLRYAFTGHSALFYHTSRMIGVILVVAGVLTIARALARRETPRGTGVIALAALLAWTGFGYWQEWTPIKGGRYAVLAHAEPRPGGGLPRYAPARPRTPWFPVNPIRAAVTESLGPRAAPLTLSYDERLFAYLPWPGYISVDRTAAPNTSRWDDRHAALRNLAAAPDLARATTPFGRIEAFVLLRRGADWTWRDVRFRPVQFSTAAFVVAELPNNTVLAIRRPS